MRKLIAVKMAILNPGAIIKARYDTSVKGAS
jgi:hypothetical protein